MARAIQSPTHMRAADIVSLAMGHRLGRIGDSLPLGSACGSTVAQVEPMATAWNMASSPQADSSRQIGKMARACHVGLVRCGASRIRCVLVRWRQLRCSRGVTTVRHKVNMQPNNAFERPSDYRGRAVLAMNCVLGGAEWAPRLAAQLGR